MTREQLIAQIECQVERARTRQTTAPEYAVLEDVLADIRLLEDGPAREQPTGDMVTVKQAAKLVGMSERWLYKNAHALPFVTHYPTGAVRCSVVAIERWKARQK